MRLTALFVGISLSLAAQASWFGGDSSTDSAVLPYTTWSTSQLTDWLDVHNIALPKHAQTDAELRDLVGDNWNKVSTWTYDQYASAQKAFVDLRESSFDKWDDSRLREFLLEQGVIAPKGPREKLILMAKEKHRAYTNAASSFSSKASSSASSMYYGDKTQQISRTLSSVAAQATKDVVGVFDHTKDYVYSTWDENRMRTYLEEKGVLKSAEQKKKEELVDMMHRAWGRVANPVWEVWSDSYLRNWLVSHNIIEPSAPKNTRDYYLSLMKQYYYSTQDRAWHGWTDSQLRQWLIDNNVIKSDAQVTRDKMVKLVEDNYYSAKDSFWNAWTDNQIRQWLIDNGYVKSDTQKKRDELIKLADEKYTDVSAKTASYLTWPDARLRAYLREHGVNEDMVPGGRPGLLQETRIRWVQAENRADTVLEKIRELVNGGVYKVEDVLSGVMHVLTTGWVDTKRTAHEDYDAAKEGYDDMKKRTGDEYEHAKRAGEARVNDAKAKARNDEEWAKEKYGDSREYTGEKVKRAGQKIKGEL